MANNHPSFALAKASFDAVTARLKQPEQNPELWSLSTGLSQLAAALEQELGTIHQKLSAIDSDVKSIR